MSCLLTHAVSAETAKKSNREEISNSEAFVDIAVLLLRRFAPHVIVIPVYVSAFYAHCNAVISVFCLLVHGNAIRSA